MESRQLECYAAVTTVLIFACLALTLRIWARRLRKLAFQLDDYLTLCAFISALVYDAVEYQWLAVGLGRHIEDLEIPATRAYYFSSLFQWTMEHAYTFSITASQLSLLALYWRAFESVHGVRTAIIPLALFVLFWFLIRLFVVAFQCVPPSAKWNQAIVRNCPVDTGKLFLGSVSSHLVIDVCLMILPACLITTLRLPPLQRLSIIAMFSFGIVVCVCSAMMLVTSSKYDNDESADLTWRQVGPANWSAVEINLSIVTACLPLMRPVFQHVKVLIFGPEAAVPDGGSVSQISGSCTWERITSSPACLGDHSTQSGTAAGESTYEEYIYGQGTGPKTCIRCGSRHNSRAGNSENPTNSIIVTNEVELEVFKAV